MRSSQNVEKFAIEIRDFFAISEGSQQKYFSGQIFWTTEGQKGLLDWFRGGYGTLS